MWVLLLFTAVAISFDALLIGIAYTMRDIRITGAAKAVIFLITYLGVLFVTALGRLASGYIPEKAFSVIGGVLLLEIGCVFLVKSQSGKEACNCDFDHSKEIDLREGITLAFALSFDSVGAAFAYTGKKEAILLLPLFSAALQVGFLVLGAVFGKTQKKKWKEQIGEGRMRCVSELLAGAILCVLGVIRLFN